jgi:hypothetical protein
MLCCEFWQKVKQNWTNLHVSTRVTQNYRYSDLYHGTKSLIPCFTNPVLSIFHIVGDRHLRRMTECHRRVEGPKSLTVTTFGWPTLVIISNRFSRGVLVHGSKVLRVSNKKIAGSVPSISKMMSWGGRRWWHVRIETRHQGEDLRWRDSKPDTRYKAW